MCRCSVCARFRCRKAGLIDIDVVIGGRGSYRMYWLYGDIAAEQHTMHRKNGQCPNPRHDVHVRMCKGSGYPAA